MWQAGMKTGYKYIADLNALNAERYLAIRQMTYSFCWRFLKLADMLHLLEMSHTVIYDLPCQISCFFCSPSNVIEGSVSLTSPGAENRLTH